MIDFEPNLEPESLPEIPLPKGWTKLVLLALLHVISLARIALLNARIWPDGPECDGLRLRAENDRLKSEIALLERELAIKDTRFNRLAPKKRPEYLPAERLEILLIKTMRGFNNKQLAKRFQVTVQTIQRWMHGIYTQSKLVQLPEKVTRYPDYLRQAIRHLKLFCPLLGRHKIAAILLRAGLHISASTVRRIIHETPQEVVAETLPDEPVLPKLTSKYPNHFWVADLTFVPTDHGVAISWDPKSLPQEYPYGFWVLNVIDHYSRRYLGFAVFAKNPTAGDVIEALERIGLENNVLPKYLVLDRGSQFDCKEFREWCQSKDMKIRFGKVGEHGSIARVERFHRSMKDECSRRIVVPTRQSEFEYELSLWKKWYNSHRPHSSLHGRTPNEIFFRKRAACTLPRIEPRIGMKHAGPCASPRVMIAGKAGRKVRLKLSFLEGRRHLPVVEILRE